MTNLDTITKAKKLGGLLANSLLDISVKEMIIDNVAQMSEETMDHIIEALETETEFLDHLQAELKRYALWQEDEWEKLSILQKRIAEDFADDEIDELRRRQKVDELKNDF